MTEQNQKQMGTTLWGIADQLRGAMNADDFRDYMLSFLFLRYLSDNYEVSAKKELGSDFPDTQDQPNTTPLQLWYDNNTFDIGEFEKQMRLKVHYVIKPNNISTATAEEEIDLTAVHADLLSLEERIVKTTNKHNEFLKELGLPLLPLVNQGRDNE